MSRPGALLAVDLGVRTGLACFSGAGRLVWYRSQNFGNRSRLRRAIPSVLESVPDLQDLVLEGGGPLAAAWEREAARRSLAARRISAEDWRRVLLYPREQRRAAVAKERADVLARRVIAWSGAPRPTSLRHDAAEAILVGLWAALESGRLAELPGALRR